MTSPAPDEEHVQPEQVVGYLTNHLSAEERRVVQAHLAECAECTAELVAVGRLHRPARPATRWLGPLAVAAAIAAIALIGPRVARQRTHPETPPVRGGDAPA